MPPEAAVRHSPVHATALSTPSPASVISRSVVNTSDQLAQFLRAEIRKNVVCAIDKHTWYNSPTTFSCPRKVSLDQWTQSVSAIKLLWQAAVEEVRGGHDAHGLNLNIDDDMLDGVSIQSIAVLSRSNVYSY